MMMSMERERKELATGVGKCGVDALLFLFRKEGLVTYATRGTYKNVVDLPIVDYECNKMYLPR